jgi:hypothetical protein
MHSLGYKQAVCLLNPYRSLLITCTGEVSNLSHVGIYERHTRMINSGMGQSVHGQRRPGVRASVTLHVTTFSSSSSSTSTTTTFIEYSYHAHPSTCSMDVTLGVHAFRVADVRESSNPTRQRGALANLFGRTNPFAVRPV